jgi:hypothetical protein
VDNREAQLAHVMAGALVGAGLAFLFLTNNGKNLLDTAEPWLEGVIRDMRRLSETVAKVREAIEQAQA